EVAADCTPPRAARPHRSFRFPAPPGIGYPLATCFLGKINAAVVPALETGGNGSERSCHAEPTARPRLRGGERRDPRLPHGRPRPGPFRRGAGRPYRLRLRAPADLACAR